MRGRHQRVVLVGLTLAGVCCVVLARVMLPEAPPMFEGIGPPPAYRYCSPPKDLASTNSRPEGGQADLPSANGVNKLGTAETSDQQVVAFFAQGVVKTNEVVHIKITVGCSGAPAAPPHSILVGNEYLLQAYTGASPDAGPPLVLQAPAQVLLRIPPIPYNTVRVFYDGGWHDTQFGAQNDLVNISLGHLGDIAAFNDTSLQTPPKAPSPFNYAGIFEAVLTVIAVLIIGAGIIAQRRRTRLDLGQQSRAATR
jgi:hypothetical protein